MISAIRDEIRDQCRDIETQVRHLKNLKEAITVALDHSPPDVDSIDTFNECIGFVTASISTYAQGIFELLSQKGGV